jgi:hypothetical protein
VEKIVVGNSQRWGKNNDAKDDIFEKSDELLK